MEVSSQDMCCLLAQPQEESQLTSKQKNMQNCQKIELHGSPTTKEIKKRNIHPDQQEGRRWAAGAERTGSQEAAGGPSRVANCGTGQARLQLADPTRWWQVVPVAPHSHIDRPGGTVGE